MRIRIVFLDGSRMGADGRVAQGALAGSLGHRPFSRIDRQRCDSLREPTRRR